MDDFWGKLYKRENIIETKGFKTIYRCKTVNEPFTTVTIKEYAIKQGDDSNNKKIKNLFEREINLLEELKKYCDKQNYSNFVAFKEKNQSIMNDRDENYYFIIREYCFTNLEELISTNNGKLEPGMIQLIMNQLNNALNILRDKKIIHRNIKPTNILINYNEDDYYNIKLSGLNYYIKYKENIPNNIPQLFKTDFHPKEFDNPGEKYDLYSIGALICFMYFGKFNENIIKEINKINDQDLKDLVEKCLKNENNRISWNDYFNHTFFKKDYGNNDNNFDFDTMKNLFSDYKTYIDQMCEWSKDVQNLSREGKIEHFKSHYDEWDNIKKKLNEFFEFTEMAKK